MNYFSTLFLICATVYQLCAQLQEAPIDVLHYRFELKLTDASNELNGRATIDLQFLANSQEVLLDLVSTRADGQGMQVEKVTLGSEHASFKHTEDKLLVKLGKTYQLGEKIQLSVYYQGIATDGLIISQNKYGDRTFFGDNWPNRAHHWLPTVDHPSDKASCEFIVTAPEHYEVIANGKKIEESFIRDGLKLTHWKTEVPLATKVMVIGVARFAIQYLTPYQDVSLQSWVYPQDRDKGFYDYAPAREVLAILEKRIGPYPYSKLANVQSKTRYGGMENAGNIFYSENSVTGNQSINRLLAHEIAHQWFGNSASEQDWMHVWLSEGFATYFTHVYIEDSQGLIKMREGLQADKALIFNYYRQHPQSPIVDKTITDINKYLNTNSYKKGSWVLQMLRFQLGEQDFWQGIRQYYAQYRHSNATTEDLQAVMENISGKDLSQFFHQWCYRAEYPKLKGHWQYEAGLLTIELEQTQSGEAFVLPIELGINSSTAKQKIELLEMNQKKQVFSLKTAQAPTTLSLDPNAWLLIAASPLVRLK